MTTYLVAVIDVHDTATFERYRAAVPTIVAAHGGRYLVRGGDQDVVEGTWPGARTTVIAFDDRQSAEAFYHSAEYQEILPWRTAATHSSVVVVDGVGPTHP